MPAVFISVLMASCEKMDTPVGLPVKGPAQYDAVEMGEYYNNQIFYDLENARVVHTSEVLSWDLAFEASPMGYHFFMNGGADVSLYNTHETDISKLTVEPAIQFNEWLFDAPCWLPDSTGAGEWKDKSNMSKNEVYIVKLNSTNNPDNNIKKIQMVSVTSTEYVMQYADIESKVAHIIHIPKDDNYNYVYFTFNNGGEVVQPDPPKNTYDIVFTRYRYIYRELDNFPYIVSGVLLNPYYTTAARDSTIGFNNITGSDILTADFSNARDVIGFDWKTYDMDKAVYTVDAEKTYIIHDRKDQYWKLHFIDFYNKQGIKGSPSFEYDRVQ